MAGSFFKDMAIICDYIRYLLIFQLLKGAPIIHPYFHFPFLSLLFNGANDIIINQQEISFLHLYTIFWLFDLLEEGSPLLHGH